MAAKRALIVDDSKTAQYRLKKLLRGYNLDTVAVDSAEAALSYLSSSVPDVVFMDHLMPGMDGFRALQIIKSHPSTATIPVIMYTSKSGDLYTSQARALGALDVVSKDTINATDLRKVLKAIHIYEEEPSDSEQAPSAKTDLEADGLAFAPDEPKTASAPPALVENAEQALSVELRLRELEHTIDDSRRIITSRLVREMQGVRHEVRRLVTHITELKTRSGNNIDEDEPLNVRDEPQPAPPANSGFWALAASIMLFALIGLLLYWAPGAIEKLESVAQAQSELGEQVAQINANAMASQRAQPVQPEPGADDSQSKMALLPDLSWALNQNSIQEFHSDLVSPQLTQRLTELISRLSSRGFEGLIRINVSGGDFCVITNLSGHAQLPEAGARVWDCMLLSELHGAAATQAKTERLESVLAESAVLNNRRIQLQVQAMSGSFGSYPPFEAETSALQWNEAARNNNRVLITLEPSTRTRTVHRN